MSVCKLTHLLNGNSSRSYSSIPVLTLIRAVTGSQKTSAERGWCYWRMPTAEYLMSCKGWREDFESPAKRSPVVSESHRNTDGQELWLRSGSSLLVCCYAFDMDLLEHVIDQTYYYCPKWKYAVASVAAVALFFYAVMTVKGSAEKNQKCSRI